MNYTQEQKTGISLYKNGQPKLAFNSYAGCGKSFLVKECITSAPNRKTLILAFNKAIAEEMKKSIVEHAKSKGVNVKVDAKTWHSLAWKYIVTLKRLKVSAGLKYWNIKKLYNVQNNSLAYESIRLLEEYFNSASNSDLILPTEFTPNISKQLVRNVFSLSNRILTDMRAKKIDCTHSFYLKEFHIAVLRGEVSLSEFDTLVIEEVQDNNDLQTDILMNIEVKQKICVGDVHQGIYGWRGATNLFKNLDDSWMVSPLSQSFRLLPHMAEKADWILKNLKGTQVTFKGYDREIPDEVNSTAYLSRGNMKLISKMIQCVNEDMTFKTIRHPDNLFEVLEDVSFVANSSYNVKNSYIKEIYNNYLDYKKETDRSLTFVSYIMTKLSDDMDREVISACKIISTLSKDDMSVLSLKKIALKYYNDKSLKPDLYLSTAHTSKGLEFRNVELADDFSTIDELIYNVAQYKLMDELSKDIDIDHFSNEAIREHIHLRFSNERIYKTFMSVIDKPSNQNEVSAIEEINLFYVAVTRAMDNINFDTPDLHETLYQVKSRFMEQFKDDLR